MKLYAHQQAALSAIRSAIGDGRESGLVTLPTGTGKTVLFTTLARELGWPTLILVHRDELVRQTEDTLAKVWPAASVGVIKAERNEIDHHDAVIASVQSLHTKRLGKMPRDRFGLIVCDEAHHAVAPSWAAVLDHFSARFVLGTTATPGRADGKGLAERFGRRPLYSYALRQAIDDGMLCRLTQYAVETTADLDSVATRMGDFAEGELARTVNTPGRNQVVVEAYEKHAAGRRALTFGVDVAHATDLARAFSRAGIKAALVTGNTPIEERRVLLADFAAGRIRVLANCAVLTEGFNDPEIDCILMARPTKSRSLYQQCVGRGLRTAEGKTDCLILDFADNSSEHKLITVMDLLGAPRAINAHGGDVITVADADRERAEREHHIASTGPLQWRLSYVCPWPELPSLKGYVSCAWWHDEPATKKQLCYLKGIGLEPSRPLTKGECFYLIDRSLEFGAAYPTPATPRQEWFLRRLGQWRERLSKREAIQLISELKATA